MNNQRQAGASINDMPDDLIPYVLTQIEMPELVRTSLLSKSFGRMWKYVPDLDLKLKKGHAIYDVYKFISGVLKGHTGQGIQQVEVGCIYKQDEVGKIDKWIKVISGWKVKSFSLNLKYGNEDEIMDAVLEYEISPRIYDWDLLESLELSLCKVNLPSEVKLLRLKFLKLCETNLTEETITDLTGSCPILNTLVLDFCNQGEDLNISIHNPSVETLKIADSGGGELIVSAPHVKHLEFFYCLQSTDYMIVAPALEEAGFYDFREDLFTDHSGSNSDRIVSLICDLSGTKQQLVLDSHVVQYFSVDDVLNMDTFEFTVPCLVFGVKITKREMMGIFNLLRSFTNLEKLYILTGPPYTTGLNLFTGELDDLDDLVGYTDYETLAGDSPWDFTKLRMVSIQADFRVLDNGDIDRLREEINNYAMVVEFFLKKAPVLEEMVIDCSRNLDQLLEETSIFHDTVQNLPKTSPTAVLKFNWRT